MLPDSHLEKAGYLNGMSLQAKGLHACADGGMRTFREMKIKRSQAAPASYDARWITSLRPMAQVAIPAADSLLTGD